MGDVGSHPQGALAPWHGMPRQHGLPKLRICIHESIQIMSLHADAVRLHLSKGPLSARQLFDKWGLVSPPGHAPFGISGTGVRCPLRPRAWIAGEPVRLDSSLRTTGHGCGARGHAWFVCGGRATEVHDLRGHTAGAASHDRQIHRARGRTCNPAQRSTGLDDAVSPVAPA